MVARDEGILRNHINPILEKRPLGVEGAAVVAAAWIPESQVVDGSPMCEPFAEAKFIFLEANGGWLVPWLERLDHHCRKFQWEVTNLSLLPPEYMRRQCWISFEPDEAMLSTTAESPLVGADRIIRASDYPHPDAKFPGVTEDLAEALEGLGLEQKRQITSESAIALYGIG